MYMMAWNSGQNSFVSQEIETSFTNNMMMMMIMVMMTVMVMLLLMVVVVVALVVLLMAVAVCLIRPWPLYGLRFAIKCPVLFFREPFGGLSGQSGTYICVHIQDSHATSPPTHRRRA